MWVRVLGSGRWRQSSFCAVAHSAPVPCSMLVAAVTLLAQAAQVGECGFGSEPVQGVGEHDTFVQDWICPRQVREAVREGFRPGRLWIMFRSAYLASPGCGFLSLYMTLLLGRLLPWSHACLFCPAEVSVPGGGSQDSRAFTYPSYLLSASMG